MMITSFRAVLAPKRLKTPNLFFGWSDNTLFKFNKFF
jgi:hypothetical protein